VPAAVLALLLSVPAADAPEAGLLARAEAAFHEGVRLREDPDAARGQFRTAAEAYAELRHHGRANAALCRDEGNAWFLAGDLPRAVFAFRRGLDLDPNDGTLREHLRLARTQVVYSTPAEMGRPADDAWPWGLPRPLPWMAAAAALVAYASGWVALTRWRMTLHGKPLGLAAFSFGVAVVLGTVWGIWAWQLRQEGRHPVVVIADDGVLLRKGNGLSYPAAHDAPVNRGVEARLLAERGAWVQVELAGGETGWVAGKYVVRE
jgi:hypothetical protein